MPKKKRSKAAGKAAAATKAHKREQKLGRGMPAPKKKAKR